MATIKNDRDILLQAGTRILSPSISILATNTSFSTSGTTTIPASITLTVSLPVARPSAVKTWTYARPDAPDNWIPFGTGDSITVSSEAFTSAVGTGAYVEYKCYVTEALYDDISATYKISYSSAGQNAIRLDLTNEAHVIATDNAGNNGVYTGAVTLATVYNGSIDDSANWTFLAAKTSVTCTEATSSRTQTVTDLTADAGYIDITASRVGYSSITARFNLTKSKGGIAYQIVPSVSAITKSSTGVYTPTTINFSALSRTYTGNSIAYTGRYKVYTSTNGTTYSLVYTSATDELSYTYTIPASISHVKGELYLASGVASLLDSETIPIVSDGKGYTLNILNGTRAIVYDKDGLNPSPAQTAFSASLYENGTVVTPSTYAWSATGVLSGTSSTATFTPGTPAAYSATATTVTLTATYTGGVSITQTVPIAISKTGIDGTPGTPGTSGTKSITITAFKWSNAGIGTYIQAFSYTWSSGAVSAYPSGWTAAAPTSPGTGYTLYQISLIITATATATTTTTDWSSATSNTIGYRQDGSIGLQGASARVAYLVTTLTSPPGPPGTTTEPNAPAGWSTTATGTLAVGYYMYQSDGLLNGTTITWGQPYLSNLKVGSLSAISANMGVVQIASGGNVYSGKTSSTDTTAGFFLGNESGTPKFSIGSPAGGSLTWNGSSLAIGGTFSGNVTGTLDGTAASTVVTTANTANSTANTANSTANTANTTANTANTTANTANTNATTAINGLTAKLNKAGDTISGRIGLSVADGIFAGTDINNGVYFGNGGLVGKKGGATTFAISTTGDATFGGTITSAKIQVTSVYAYGGYTAAITGDGGTSIGLFGRTTTSAGVLGQATGTSGIAVSGTGHTGVKGYSSWASGSPGYGVHGVAGTGTAGVFGEGTGANVGVYATAGTGNAMQVAGKTTVNNTITSTLATGTAPIIVTSTTECTNLNASKLQGNSASAFATATHNHLATYISAINGNSGQTIPFAANSQINLTSAVGAYTFAGSGSTLSFNAVSDRRLKEDIVPEKLGLDFILKLKPVRYKLLNKDTDFHGFIAQDLDDIDLGSSNDSLRITNNDGTKGIDYVSIISPIVKALQELTDKVSLLELELERLKNGKL